MATIRLYHDVRAVQDGERAPIKIAVNHKGSTAFIPTGISCTSRQWDARAQTIIDKRMSSYKILLEQKRMSAEVALLHIIEEGRAKNCTATQLRDMVSAVLSGKEQRQITVGEFFDKVTATKTGSTKRNYAYVAKYTRSKYDIDSMQFSEVTRDMVSALVLDDRFKDSSKVVVRSVLTSVFNEAIDDGITTNYPFRKIGIKKPVFRKRSLSADTIRAVFSYEPTNDAMRYAIDIFKLTFYLIGINSADLFDCPPMVDGRVEYIRKKTSRPYSIKAEPEALEIIERYKGEGSLLNHRYSTSHTLIYCVNTQLDKIVKGLTLYWARHSWATIAYNDCGISKDTISLALGHHYGSEVTDIYINPSLKLIDEANRKVIDFISL